MDNDGGPLWVTRDEAKAALEMTEREFSEAVMSGKIISHRFGKWTSGYRETLYFIGKIKDEEQ